MIKFILILFKRYNGYILKKKMSKDGTRLHS